MSYKFLLAIAVCMIGCDNKVLTTQPITMQSDAAVDAPDPQSEQRAKDNTIALVNNTDFSFRESVENARNKCAPVSSDCGSAAQNAINQFRKLVEIVDGATEIIDVSKYQGIEYEAAKRDLTSFDTLMSQYKNYESNPPTQPTKPVYSPPSYHGAFYFSGGIYHGTYKDGIILSQNDTYFFIDNESCSSFFGMGRCNIGSWVNGGYEEYTGRTISLPIGRYGREAEVLRDVDRATYEDDQQEYARDMENYRALFEGEKREYVAKLAAIKADSAKHGTDKMQCNKLADKLSITIGAYYNHRFS